MVSYRRAQAEAAARALARGRQLQIRHETTSAHPRQSPQQRRPAQLTLFAAPCSNACNGQTEIPVLQYLTALQRVTSRTCTRRKGGEGKEAAGMKKKVDPRVRALIEACVATNHRSLFVIVGDKGRHQVRRRLRPLRMLALRHHHTHLRGAGPPR